MKSYSLSEMKDTYTGKTGTIERDKYEHDLRMDVLGRMIKKARQERNLTQEQLYRLYICNGPIILAQTAITSAFYGENFGLIYKSFSY